MLSMQLVLGLPLILYHSVNPVIAAWLRALSSLSVDVEHDKNRPTSSCVPLDLHDAEVGLLRCGTCHAVDTLLWW